MACPDRAVQDPDNLIAGDRMDGASGVPGVLATHISLCRDVPATGNMTHLRAKFGIDQMARPRPNRLGKRARQVSAPADTGHRQAWPLLGARQ